MFPVSNSGGCHDCFCLKMLIDWLGQEARIHRGQVLDLITVTFTGDTGVNVGYDCLFRDISTFLSMSAHEVGWGKGAITYLQSKDIVKNKK